MFTLEINDVTCSVNQSRKNKALSQLLTLIECTQPF